MFEDFQKSIRITRKASPSHDLIVGFAHYFPLSFLPDEFWEDMATNPAFRVTDGAMTELPIQVLDLNVPAKTGSLWFRDNKADTKKAYFIHWDSEATTGFDVLGPFAATAVWADYADAIPLNENPSNVFFFNLRALGLTGSFSSNTGNHTGNWIDGPLEQKANHFFDSKDNRVTFGAGSLSTFSTAKTFFFMFKLTKTVSGLEHLFGNWRDGFTGQQVFRVILLDDQMGIQLGESGLGWYNLTTSGQLDDIEVGSWNLAAIHYDQGMGGIQIDVNGLARVLDYDEGIFPSDMEASTRTVGGIGTNGSDVSLSMIATFDGALDKDQRDQVNVNWRTPAEFWKVLTGPGEVICFSSPMEKNICLSSHMNEEVCFTSKLKG